MEKVIIPGRQQADCRAAQWRSTACACFRRCMCPMYCPRTLSDRAYLAPSQSPTQAYHISRLLVVVVVVVVVAVVCLFV